MAPALDPARLPAELRPLVERALADVDCCEEAIQALEQHLNEPGGRSPDLLVALALLTYREAAELVVTRLEEAAERALGLLREAEQRGVEPTEGLAHLRALCAEALEAERARARALIGRVVFGADADPLDIVELAHRLLLRSEDDALAAELLRRAAILAEPNLSAQDEATTV